MVWYKMCTSQARLEGKTAIITGANTGIGLETALDFYKRGARVILACRNMEKAQEAINDIKKKCTDVENVGQLEKVELDLTKLSSVRSCAEKLLAQENRIDLLINNAGIMMVPYGKTEDGHEMHFGVNHLGPFLFTLLLLPKISKSPKARIVNVSSLAHVFTWRMRFHDLNWESSWVYISLLAYAQSKLANVLFTRELAKRLKAANIQGVNVYSLHPGSVYTDLGRHMTGFAHLIFQYGVRYFGKNALQGAQTTIYCAVDEETANESGLYYDNCAKANPNRLTVNDEEAEKLWKASVEIVGLTNYDPFKL